MACAVADGGDLRRAKSQQHDHVPAVVAGLARHLIDRASHRSEGARSSMSRRERQQVPTTAGRGRSCPLRMWRASWRIPAIGIRYAVLSSHDQEVTGPFVYFVMVSAAISPACGH
jgi:hypothetical protein